jgi:hypothetical protein
VCKAAENAYGEFSSEVYLSILVIDSANNAVHAVNIKGKYDSVN